MKISASSAFGYYAYGLIDSNTLRNNIDKFFPSFAKNLDADFISGMHHRYKGGHDLLIDVPKTFINKSSSDALKQTGHILLTDFPTKTGIPIPGFSHSGLGNFLENVGISKGWLSINIMDGATGFLAISDSHFKLMEALAGTLYMDKFVFFDTFVEGSLEIALSVVFKNPLLLFAGIENIFAGIVSSVKTLSIYVDPLEFFGAGIFSAILGATISFILQDGNITSKVKNAINNGLKSSIISMAFCIESFFGLGLLSGYITYEIVKKISFKTNSHIQNLSTITQEQLDSYFKLVCETDKNFKNFYTQTKQIQVIDTTFSPLIKLHNKNDKFAKKI